MWLDGSLADERIVVEIEEVSRAARAVYEYVEGALAALPLILCGGGLGGEDGERGGGLQGGGGGTHARSCCRERRAAALLERAMRCSEEGEVVRSSEERDDVLLRVRGGCGCREADLAHWVRQRRGSGRGSRRCMAG